MCAGQSRGPEDSNKENLGVGPYREWKPELVPLKEEGELS